MDPFSVPEISPGEFTKAVEAGKPLQVVDVRSPQRVAAGRIHIVSDGRFHNIPGSSLIHAPSLEAVGIDPGIPVVVVCGHGNDSKIGAAVLNRLGASARSLSGGMASWMNLAVPRSVPAPDGFDRLLQFDRVGKGSIGYLLESSGEAIIIDPPRDPAPFFNAMKESGSRLVAVADTHVHADYISGAPALAADLHIPYYLHPSDNIFPYDESPGRLETRPVTGGTSIRVGRGALTVVHTPGHSPGSVTYMVGADAAFTGDFLFVGSVGRPDIADRTEEWAPLLWRSLQSAKHAWPPGLMIYPAHYAAESERAPGGAVCAAFGVLLKRNPALVMEDEPGFLGWIRNTGAIVPAAYRSIKAINVGLLKTEEREQDELESGKNECALGLPPSDS